MSARDSSFSVLYNHLSIFVVIRKHICILLTYFAWKEVKLFLTLVSN